MPVDPFLLDELSAPARWVLDRALALPAYRDLYRGVRSDVTDSEPFERRALRALHISSEVSDADLNRLPPKGAVVIVANHPHGAVDGLLLADGVRRVRPDVRVLTNYLLARIPELHDLCFFVDPFEGRQAAERSRAGLRAAHLWLRRGGVLIAFPAGEVAHELDGDAPIDTAWSPTIVRLAQSAGAPVVPAWIDGRNSRLFYAAGTIHPRLRTVLLGRELLKQRGRTVTIRIGSALSPHTEAATLRHKVEQLADPIAAEVARLPADALLLESGAFQIFCADSRQIPTTLSEIGRLRERTYRAVGEGTGRDLDIDAFDDGYLHLFSWDRDRRQVVGAYRIGRTDRIVAVSGVEGLYTRSLFRYDARLIDKLSPALELGRSFVRAEYQRNYNALLLLWKGIGRFVARHPEYRYLFGAVSISARYSDHSQQLLMAFLEQNHRDQDLAQLVNATRPSKGRRVPPTELPRSIDELNDVITELEADGKIVPVLLRQYLKLNARVIGFNVDVHFGEALDALMVVDLPAVDCAILDRYLGRPDAAKYVARHRAECSGRPRAAA
jgi:putative hemolysin